MKEALITGVTRQDGAYPAEFLLSKGDEVQASSAAPRYSTPTASTTCTRTPHEKGRRFILHHGDLTDSSSLIRIIQQVQFDAIYNFAAQQRSRMPPSCSGSPSE